MFCFFFLDLTVKVSFQCHMFFFFFLKSWLHPLLQVKNTKNILKCETVLLIMTFFRDSDHKSLKSVVFQIIIFFIKHIIIEHVFIYSDIIWWRWNLKWNQIMQSSMQAITLIRWEFHVENSLLFTRLMYLLWVHNAILKCTEFLQVF